MSDGIRDVIDIYVINYENEKRKDQIKNRFDLLNFEVKFTPGVSGSDERIAKIPKSNRHAAPCMLAHLDTIREYYENSDKKYGIICEDDILIRKTFAQDMVGVIRHFEELELDILLLGYLLIAHPRYEKPPDGFQIKTKFTYHQYHEQLWGCQMYMITKKHAKWCLDTFTIEWTLTNSPFSSDWTITKNGNRALIYPMLAIEDPVDPKNIKKLNYQIVYIDGIYKIEEFI